MIAVLVAACIPTPEPDATAPPRVEAVALDFPGGVYALADTPWGTTVAGNSQERVWLAVSQDGVGWAEVGRPTTRALPQLAGVSSMASNGTTAVVLLNLVDPSGDGELAVLWSDDGVTWILLRPDVMQVDDPVTPVAVAPYRDGYVVIAYAGRGALQMLGFTSTDGRSWARLPDLELRPNRQETAVTPTAVVGHGDQVIVTAELPLHVQADAPSLFTGTPTGTWESVDVPELSGNILHAVAVKDDDLLVGGCTANSPVHGTIWLAPVDELDPFDAVDLGPEACVDAIAADASGVSAAGTEGGVGKAWVQLPDGTWEPIELPFLDPERQLLQVASVARLGTTTLVGGTANSPIFGPGPAPAIWIIRADAP